jgi:hypothetical protein
MELKVGCRLRYLMPQATAFVFQIEAAKADSQVVKSESLTIPSGSPRAAVDSYADPVTLTRKVRTFLGPGPVEVFYEATVDVELAGFDPARVLEFDFADLPMEYLEYLAPSRYCPSDTFTEFAYATFGKRPRGHTRVTAICDWIFNGLLQEGHHWPKLDLGRRISVKAGRVPGLCASGDFAMPCGGHTGAVRQRLCRCAAPARLSCRVPGLSQRSEGRRVVCVRCLPHEFG